MEKNGRQQTLVFLCFFLSGACGLVYEVVWTRLLTLVVGNTVFSVTTVLTAFMGGLALGSYIAGKIIDRRFNPLRFYGWLEGAIGVYCLAIPWLIEALVPLYRTLYQDFGHPFYLLSLMRFVLCGAILLFPTTLMGATLPILSKHLVGKMDRLGWDIGRLYSLNIFGAVLGASGTGFALIPWLGIRSTIHLAAAINLGIALAILLWPQRAVHRSLPDETVNRKKKERRNTREPAQDLPSPSLTSLRLALWGLGVSGFAAMVYQIAWTRVLSLAIGSSVYAFSLILTAFIAGLALGSLLCSRFLDRLRFPLAIFGLFEVAIGLAALLILPLLGNLPIHVVGIIRNYAASFALLQGVELGVVFLLILVPTFLLGATFPLASKVYAQRLEGVGKAIGNVYAANTLGAILGSFCGGFLLIPWLGIWASILAAAALNLVMGSILYLWGSSLPWGRKGIGVGIGIAVTLILATQLPPWDRHVLNSGAYIYAGIYDMGPQTDSSQVEEAMRAQGELLYHEEGVSATVSVLRRAIDASLTLQINGKVDASTRRRDMITQVVSGHLPLLLHPDPQDVLLIGLGSGITLGGIERYPVKGVDVLEISPEVIEASHFFSQFNHDALEDRRANLIVGDGRNHLLLSNKKYDVIISEPSNLWIAGMAHLFTQDFYRLARKQLEIGGIMCQWIQGYFMAPKDFKSLIHTFQQVFPHASLWEISPAGDYLLIGMEGGWSLEYSTLKARVEAPSVQADLARVGLGDSLDLLGMLVLKESDLKAYTDRSPLHTDDNILLEFSAPVALYQRSHTTLLEEMSSYRGTATELEIRWGREGKAFQERLNRIHQARRHTVAGILSMEAGEGNRALEEIEQAIILNPQDVQANFSLRDLAVTWGDQHLQQGLVEGAIRLYQRILTINPRLADVHYLLAQAYQSLGMDEQARAAYEEARRLNPQMAGMD